MKATGWITTGYQSDQWDKKKGKKGKKISWIYPNIISLTSVWPSENARKSLETSKFWPDVFHSDLSPRIGYQPIGHLFAPDHELLSLGSTLCPRKKKWLCQNNKYWWHWQSRFVPIQNLICWNSNLFLSPLLFSYHHYNIFSNCNQVKIV